MHPSKMYLQKIMYWSSLMLESTSISVNLKTLLKKMQEPSFTTLDPIDLKSFSEKRLMKEFVDLSKILEFQKSEMLRPS